MRWLFQAADCRCPPKRHPGWQTLAARTLTGSSKVVADPVQYSCATGSRVNRQLMGSTYSMELAFWCLLRNGLRFCPDTPIRKRFVSCMEMCIFVEFYFSYTLLSLGRGWVESSVMFSCQEPIKLSQSATALLVGIVSFVVPALCYRCVLLL